MVFLFSVETSQEKAVFRATQLAAALQKAAALKKNLSTDAANAKASLVGMIRAGSTRLSRASSVADSVSTPATPAKSSTPASATPHSATPVHSDSDFQTDQEQLAFQAQLDLNAAEKANAENAAKASQSAQTDQQGTHISGTSNTSNTISEVQLTDSEVKAEPGQPGDFTGAVGMDSNEQQQLHTSSRTDALSSPAIAAHAGVEVAVDDSNPADVQMDTGSPTIEPAIVTAGMPESPAAAFQLSANSISSNEDRKSTPAQPATGASAAAVIAISRKISHPSQAFERQHTHFLAPIGTEVPATHTEDHWKRTLAARTDARSCHGG